MEYKYKKKMNKMESIPKKHLCKKKDIYVDTHTHTHTHTHKLGRFSKGQEGTEMGLGQDSYLKE